MKRESTGWEIEGASGATVKAGTPIVNVEVGASYLRLPIKNSDSGKSVMLQGVGIGVGAGVSISTPVVSASGSLDQFPADGIGSIVKGPGGLPRTYQEKDFYGNLMVFSLGVGKEISGQLSGVLWLNRPVEYCLASLSCSSSELKQIARNTLFSIAGVAVPGGALVVSANRLKKLTRAAGVFAAMNVETQLIGAGVDVFSYRVSG